MPSKMIPLRELYSKRLIFGVRQKTGESFLIFIPENEAQRLSLLHRAIASSKTWGEFREQMSSADFKYVMDFLAGSGDDLPADSDEFEIESLPGFTDGDWPDWPEQKMFEWLPIEICRRYGRSESSMLNGPFLVLDLYRMPEILAALSRAGFECVRDDRLVLEACGDCPEFVRS